MVAIETVTCRGRIHALLEGTYWHLTKAGDFLLHNAVLHEGLSLSVSAIAEEPGLQNAVTPYALKVMNDPKEQAWENVRRAINPNLPSRSKSLYVFDREDLAQAAMAQWFPRERRSLIRTRVVAGSAMHRADARWLDCVDAGMWEGHASCYWRGIMTEQPFPEVLVHGAVFFPEWG